MSLLNYFCNYSNRKKTKESLPGAQSLLYCSQKREAPKCACCTGSLTVEAAMLLPLFAAFFAFLLFFFQIMRVQLVIQGALEETARGLVVLSAKELEATEKEPEYLIIAKGVLFLKLNEEAETLRFVRGGISGISLLASEFGQDEIILRADYVMRFPISFFGNQNFSLSQMSYYRKWTGMDVEGEKGLPDELVYVTEYGEVYHRKRTCPYINLTIRKVLEEHLEVEKNKNGEHYEKCEKCCGEMNLKNVVYVTDYGDKYHEMMNCSGLKRTIYQKRISEVGGMPACGKCAK